MGGILSITEVIFDPHFQRRERVLRAAQAAGFREKSFFGRRLAYTLHLEKIVDARKQFDDIFRSRFANSTIKIIG